MSLPVEVLDRMPGEPTIRHAGQTVDVVAVRRVLTRGRPQPELTEGEQRYVVWLLAGAGLTVEAIAYRAGMSSGQVRGWLSRGVV